MNLPSFHPTDQIQGLGNTISDLNKADSDLRNNVQSMLGVSNFPWPVKDGTVTNKKLIVWQIEGLPEKMKVPDLIMNINPQSLDTQYSQLINRKRTHGGFIEEHWGEQLDSLSASGFTKQFYNKNGLTNLNRRDTESYSNFEKFIAMYRNNGSIYDDKTSKVIGQGSVIMNYDSAIYGGYFENLSITEIPDKPYRLEYNFSFKVTIEIFPGAMQSFKQVTTIPTATDIQNDNVSLDITTFKGNK